MFKLRRHWHYSQDELGEHIGQMAQLIKEREKAMQLATVQRSDPKQQRYLEQVDRLDDAIAICQETLNFMLERNLRRVSK